MAPAPLMVVTMDKRHAGLGLAGFDFGRFDFAQVGRYRAE
jgi:hypothetical protein